MLTLGKGLNQYQKEGFLSFHTPGHKGKPEFFAGIDFPHQDLTELPGLDMLHGPQGVIRQAQERAAEVFGAEESFYLINGATVGNQAMLLSLGDSEGSRKPILIPRQSHRSVVSGLVLSGLRPVYIPALVHPEFSLPLGLDHSRLGAGGQELQDLLAIHLTYPGYYGSLPDLKALIVWRDQWVPQTPVLVDQAHGSHYLSDLFPESALKLGADGVLHSTHKTLSALTQGAILHRQGQRLQSTALRQALELLQSSSPNYLIMASLEKAVELAGETWRWEALREAVLELHCKVEGRLRLLNFEDEGSYGISRVDWSKILVNTRSLGVPAPVCVEHLRRVFRIEPELWDEENILFILGIGNTPEEVSELSKGLLSLEKLRDKEYGDRGRRMNPAARVEAPVSQVPPQLLSPREAFLAPKRRIPFRESLGAVAGESISPYPPGVPLIMMGEEITAEVLDRLADSSIRCWQGWAEPGQTILVMDR